MKAMVCLGLLAICLSAGAVETGASREAIIAELGEPSGTMQRDGTEILVFNTGTVTLQNGVVIKASFPQDYAQKAEERVKQAEVFRAKKQAELEKQKQLYPEDRVIRIGCAYGKNENWDWLPEVLRPAQGNYGYDIYIPPGYHESEDRYFKCLFIESRALWNSIKERVRKEKWMVVILPDVPQEKAGQLMNSLFLAAYDDATERFRIARDSRFIVGRVPAALFATLRPVAGIILQEPDFSGFEKAEFNPEFLRLNPELRAYVLLGNQDRNNVDYQAKFIIDRIPKHYIGVYEGSTTVLPQPLADSALDWMEKEYNLP
jgi:hypothetical protein